MLDRAGPDMSNLDELHLAEQARIFHATAADDVERAAYYADIDTMGGPYALRLANLARWHRRKEDDAWSRRRGLEARSACAHCAGPIERQPRGRPAKYCGTPCRKAAKRARDAS